MKLPRIKTVFKILGVIFALIGTFTFINIAYALALGGPFMAGMAAYGLMDLLIAYAFFTRERWLITALALNLAACTIFVLYAGLLRPDASLVSRFIAFLLNLLVFVAAYQGRKSLSSSNLGWVVGLLFFLTWAYSIFYTIMRSFLF